MGKRRKRLTLKKYANKYAAKRKGLGLGAKESPETTPEEVVEVPTTTNALKQLKPKPPETEESIQVEDPAPQAVEESPPPVDESPPKKTTRRRRKKPQQKKQEKISSES